MRVIAGSGAVLYESTVDKAEVLGASAHGAAGAGTAASSKAADGGDDGEDAGAVTRAPSRKETFQER